MTPDQERIKALILEGWRTGEIMQEITTLRKSTVRSYAHTIRKSLSTSEVERASAALAARTRLTGPNVRGDYRTRFADRKTLSAQHIRIGRQLAFARQKAELSLTEFARFHNFGNALMLTEAEQGFFDFTLSQINQIAEIIGITPEALMHPPDLKDAA